MVVSLDETTTHEMSGGVSSTSMFLNLASVRKMFSLKLLSTVSNQCRAMSKEEVYLATH